MTKFEIQEQARAKAERVRSLAQEGMSKAAICKTTGISPRTIGRILASPPKDQATQAA